MDYFFSHIIYIVIAAVVIAAIGLAAVLLSARNEAERDSEAETCDFACEAVRASPCATRKRKRCIIYAGQWMLFSTFIAFRLALGVDVRLCSEARMGKSRFYARSVLPIYGKRSHSDSVYYAGISGKSVDDLPFGNDQRYDFGIFLPELPWRSCFT